MSPISCGEGVSRLMAVGDDQLPEHVRAQPDRPHGLLLAAAGALVFAGSLAPWPEIDLLRLFSADYSSGFLLEHGLLTLPAGIGIIVIGSRIALEAGRRRRPWTAWGITLLMLGAGLVVAWVSFDLFGESAFQLTPLPLVFLSGLTLIGSRLPMGPTATRPRSVALALAVVALGDFLVLFATFAVADPEYGPNSSGLQLGWLVATLGALIATVAALRLRSRAQRAATLLGIPEGTHPD